MPPTERLNIPVAQRPARSKPRVKPAVNCTVIPWVTTSPVAPGRAMPISTGRSVHVVMLPMERLNIPVAQRPARSKPRAKPAVNCTVIPWVTTLKAAPGRVMPISTGRNVPVAMPPTERLNIPAAQRPVRNKPRAKLAVNCTVIPWGTTSPVTRGRAMPISTGRNVPGVTLPTERRNTPAVRRPVRTAPFAPPVLRPTVSRIPIITWEVRRSGT